MKRKLISAFLLASVFAVPAISQAGFVKGNDYQEMDINQRVAFIAGTVDSLFSLHALEKSFSDKVSLPSGVNTIVECLLTKPLSQVVEIIEKQHNNNPENWDVDMTDTIIIGLAEACK